MWYPKQAASPASSTSTVDQQEILFDDQQQQQQPTSAHLQGTTNVVTKTGRGGRQAGLGRGARRPRKIAGGQQYSKTNGTTNKSGATSRLGTNSSAASNNKCSPPKRLKLFNNASSQVAPWKALQHHFMRYTDIKYRPEKRMTMAELGNEVLRRRSGWKVHHFVTQLTELIENETRTRERISSLLELFVEKGAQRVHDLANNCHKLPEQDAASLQSQRSYGKNEFNPELIATKLDDLLRGDIQRSNVFDLQLRDCRDLIVRITNEHRDRVSRITTKFNKRIQL